MEDERLRFLLSLSHWQGYCMHWIGVQFLSLLFIEVIWTRVVLVCHSNWLIHYWSQVSRWLLVASFSGGTLKQNNVRPRWTCFEWFITEHWFIDDVTCCIRGWSSLLANPVIYNWALIRRYLTCCIMGWSSLLVDYYHPLVDTNFVKKEVDFQCW